MASAEFAYTGSAMRLQFERGGCCGRTLADDLNEACEQTRWYEVELAERTRQSFSGNPDLKSTRTDINVRIEKRLECPQVSVTDFSTRPADSHRQRASINSVEHEAVYEPPSSVQINQLFSVPRKSVKQQTDCRNGVMRLPR